VVHNKEQDNCTVYIAATPATIISQLRSTTPFAISKIKKKQEWLSYHIWKPVFNFTSRIRLINLTFLFCTGETGGCFIGVAMEGISGLYLLRKATVTVLPKVTQQNHEKYHYS